jgi:hypothetical protein
MGSSDNKGSPPRRGKCEVKIATVKAHLTQLEKLGLLGAVMENLPEASRRALQSSPLPTAWVDVTVMHDIVVSVEKVAGMDAVRTVSLQVQKAGTTPLLMPIIGGLMRLFGATPNTLLSRFDDLVKTQLRGAEFQWALDSPKSGRLTVTFPRTDTPRAAFVGFESGCRGILDLCKVQGEVELLEVRGGVGVIRVRWN